MIGELFKLVWAKFVCLAIFAILLRYRYYQEEQPLRKGEFDYFYFLQREPCAPFFSSWVGSEWETEISPSNSPRPGKS